jgi:hypothetical protein
MTSPRSTITAALNSTDFAAARSLICIADDKASELSKFHGVWVCGCTYVSILRRIARRNGKTSRR